MKIVGIVHPSGNILRRGRIGSRIAYERSSVKIVRYKSAVNSLLTALIATIGLAAAGLTAAAQPPKFPGNVNNPDYTWAVWLTPESYNTSGAWTNLCTGVGGIGDFLRMADAPSRIVGDNFHHAVLFAKPSGGASPNRLRSANQMPIGSDENVSLFIVFRRPGTDIYDCLLAMNPSDNRNLLSWRAASNSANNRHLTYRWGNSGDSHNVGPISEGILTVDNPNSAATTHVYKDGTQTTLPATSFSGAEYVMLSNAHTGGAYYGFQGTVQELIILKKSGNGHLDPVDIQKIHSYLAVKYGVTLSTDYLASDGATSVWSRTAAPANYNSGIFGIARDDDYSLYQKQSRPASAAAFAIFVGNNLLPLNGSNSSGTLDNGVYVMLGSNGVSVNSTTVYNHTNGTSFNGTLLNSPHGLNYRSRNVHKAQLTGTSSINVKLSMQGVVHPYCLVSKSESFLPAETEIYAVQASGVVEINLSGEFKYIAFAGYKTHSGTAAPGGVSTGLKLWLRADEATLITGEHLVTSNVDGSKTRSYPDAPEGTAVTGVSEWRDLTSGKLFSYANGASSDAHLEPVYQQSNYLTNYHPTLRFWGVSNGTAYLTSAADSIWNTQFPADNKHSAFFLGNNFYGINQWFYTMMFGSAYPSSYQGPGYGVDKQGTNMVGRYRTSGGGNGDADCRGSVHLFAEGATSILGYHSTVAGNKIDVQWRFNGKEDTRQIGLGNFNLKRASIIGGGYANNRALNGVMPEIIMYDGVLADADRDRIESYMALKYGITMRPSSNATGRFHYKFSDGTTVWNGNQDAANKYSVYYNRVAAVIRDDAAGMHNRQSHSTDVGSILHMGVAGIKLGTAADVGDLKFDKEVVAWGDNGKTGVQTAPAISCGQFEHIFNRIWMVRKLTNSNRAITMIVGAQDNHNNQLGANGVDIDLFSKLSAANTVRMLVADSAENLTPGHARYGDFTMLQMQFLDGEQQCQYTFADSITYICFGYTPQGGCAVIDQLDGSKTFQWTQWTRQNYSQPVNQTRGEYQLDPNFKVTSTSIVYDNSIIAPTYYPSVSNSPEIGSLYLQRRSGTSNSDVVVTVNFNQPVRPEFSVYDIDGIAGRFERVSIMAYCDDGKMVVPPDLSYAGTPSASYYKISGNTATANRPANVTTSSRNGQLNVSFQQGVTKLVIRYDIINWQPTAANRNLVISPITIRPVPPAPPVNDNLSLVKEVKKKNIAICEEAEYSIYISNVLCAPRYVHLRDTLPDKMKWVESSVVLDPENSSNPSVKIYPFGNPRILAIDSLLIPGGSTIKIMANASLDNDAVVLPEPAKRFNNRAWMIYKHSSTGTSETWPSVDRESLEPYTWFNAHWAQVQADDVETSITVDKAKYAAGDLVKVTVKANNPNAPIADMYLSLSFDAGFEYEAPSFTATNAPTAVLETPVQGAGSITVAGHVDGSTGFNLPNGISTYTFDLRAPAHDDLEEAIDEEGNPIEGKVATLNVVYEFNGGTGDPCLHIADMTGEEHVPYSSNEVEEDRAVTTVNTPVKIPVLANDVVAAACPREPEPYILAPPDGQTSGTAVRVNDSILYTPAPDFVGVDSLAYSLSCGYDVNGAKIFVAILKPGSQKYVACPGASIELSVEAIFGVQYKWYDTESSTVSLSGVNSLTFVKDNSGAMETRWVEAEWNGRKFPRYRIDILAGSNCGNTPSGCLSTGTVVWKEDFDSYGTTQDLAPDPGWTGSKTTYTYEPGNNAGTILPRVNYYALLKGQNIGGSPFWSFSPLHDHTSPADNTKGYFLSFDATQAAGQFYEFDMTGLCAGTDLLFSAWLMNINPSSWNPSDYVHPIVEFQIRDKISNDLLSVFNTGTIAKQDAATWVNYAFPFTVPVGVNAVTVKFMNAQLNAGGTSGNDISIDDIEVRLCAPEVLVTQPAAADTGVCAGTPINFVGSYTDDGTFQYNTIQTQWIHSVTGDLSNPGAWNPVVGSQVSGSGTVSNTLQITSAASVNEGYYRLVAADAANFGDWNCRAMSRVIHLNVLDNLDPGTIGAAQTTCSGIAPASLSFLTPPSGGSGGPYTYLWQQKANSASSWTNVDPAATTQTYSPPALTETTKYRVEVTDASGSGNCMTAYTDEIEITVLPVPAINDTVITICSGSTFSISPVDGVHGDFVPAGTRYSWPQPSSSAVTGMTPESNYATVSQTVPLVNSTSTAQTVVYNVTPTVPGTVSCSGSEFTVTVIVTNQPAAGTLSYNSGIEICRTGSPVSPAWTSPPTAGGSETYTVTSANPAGANLTVNSANGEITPGSSDVGTYEVTYTMSASGGCSGLTRTATVNIADRPEVSNLSFTLAPLCDGGTLSEAMLVAPTVTPNNSSTTGRWEIETVSGNSIYVPLSLPHTASYLDYGKHIRYTAWNNCDTVSSANTVNLSIWQIPRYPDIRLQVCTQPSPRSIYLSSYLDTLNITGVIWNRIAGSDFVGGSPNTGSGELRINSSFPLGTHIYEYQITNTCGAGSGRVYVKNTANPVVTSTLRDTIAVCWFMPSAAHLQLNQIMGLEANGTWGYDMELDPYMSVASSPSQFAGAYVFDASAAWSNLKSAGFGVTYNGDSNSAKFVFKYTTPVQACFSDKTRELVIIVTSKLLPLH